jgi:alpha-1,2-mannosyltransferase
VQVQVWIDTTGWALPYPLVWLAGARIVTYVHYPTISTDMFARVQRRDSSYNNPEAISLSTPRTLAKLLYYRAFACLYGFVGMFPDVVMVNSSWTHGHILCLWWRRWRRPAVVVHPPCDVLELEAIPLARSIEQSYLCSIAQFRPEKDHRYASSSIHDRVHPDLQLVSIRTQSRLLRTAFATDGIEQHVR